MPNAPVSAPHASRRPRRLPARTVSINARDIMTTRVVTAGPQATIQEIAALLLEHRISGVPIVEGGRLVGIVTQADLLPRVASEDLPRSSWWSSLFTGDPSPAQYVRSHAHGASDIMQREVITVTPDTPAAEIARLLESRSIRRVPVMRGEELVGIVSRGDLVRGLARRAALPHAELAPTDAAIRARLLEELKRHTWWHALSTNIVVTDGVVHYWGLAHSDDERRAARVAAENIAGVRGVEDHRHRAQELVSMI